MKVKLPTAAARRKQTANSVERKKDSLKKIVAQFLNGPVREAIAEAEEQSVNVEVPIRAYEDMPGFYSLCENALKPLGYQCEQSHDGGGMYSTLYVSWNKKY